RLPPALGSEHAAPAREGSRRCERREWRRPDGAEHLAGGRMARARSLGHVRHRLRWSRRSAPAADARGLGRASGAQGLPGSDQEGGADLRAARSQPGRVQSQYRSRSTETVALNMAELRTETMTVNMGPQHPSTHGVLRLVLEIDGETIKSIMPTIGYL